MAPGFEPDAGISARDNGNFIFWEGGKALYAHSGVIVSEIAFPNGDGATSVSVFWMLC